MAVLLAVGSAGCGDEGDGGGGKSTVAPIKHRAPTAAEADAIRTTIAELERAIADGDVRTVCGLYTEDARQTQAEAYTSCDTATRSDLEGEKPPRLTVGGIEVTGARGEPGVLEASAVVTSDAPKRHPFQVDAVLVTEGGSWRIDDGVLDYVLKPSAGTGSGGGEEPGDE